MIASASTGIADVPSAGDADAASDQDKTELAALTQAVGDCNGLPNAEIPPGTTFGRFRIVRILGRGGMGVVHLARQTEPVARDVAIKVMAIGAFQPEHRLRFALEAQALATMAHPGIAQIHDAGATADGRLYFVMEFVPGRPLAEWLAQPDFGITDRVRLVRDACRAVAHAHGRGVLHCDLKPGNILVAEVDGRAMPKLIDFGIARMAGTLERESVGTPGYMSPEQAAGEVIDTRSDVYALGVILREILGVPKPAGASETRPRESPVSDRAILPSIGRTRAAELSAILARATMPARELRYPNADALADDLSRWLEREPVHAYSNSDLYRLRCLVRRQAGISATVAVFLAVCAVLAWRLFVQLEATRRERDTATQMTELLLETFRSADPYQFPGGSISTRDLLRTGAGRVTGKPLDAIVRQRVLTALGDLQSRLELYADASQTLGLAADLAQGPERERILLAQAQAMLNDESFEAAAQLVDERIAILRRDDPLELLPDALLVRAEIAEYVEDLALAGQLLDETSALLANHDAPELDLRLLRQRGRVALANGNPGAAVQWLGSARTAASKLYGDMDLRTIDCLSDLAIAEAQAGNLDASERHRRDIVAATEATWGEDSPGLAIALDNLGAILQRQGGAARLAEAVALAERAYTINRRMLGESSMHTALSANNFANSLAASGRHDEAQPLHAQAVAGLEKILGATHSHVGIARHNQARTWLALGRLDDASRGLEASGQILRESLGDAHPRLLVWELTRAELLHAQDRGAGSAALLGRIEPGLTAAFGPDGPEARRVAALRSRLGTP